MIDREYEEIASQFSKVVSQMLKESDLPAKERSEITRKKNYLLRLIQKKLHVHPTLISFLVNQNEK